MLVTTSWPRAGESLEGACPIEEILSRAHGNFEEQNKVLGPYIIIINYCIINVNAYYNYLITA